MTIAAEPAARVERNYVNQEYSLKSWLLTTDHKRIGILYLSLIHI